MASMGAPAPDPAAATGASSSRQQQQLSVPCLTHNVRVVENARGLMSIVAGSITGILGVTGVVQVRGWACHVCGGVMVIGWWVDLGDETMMACMQSSRLWPAWPNNAVMA